MGRFGYPDSSVVIHPHNVLFVVLIGLRELSILERPADLVNVLFGRVLLDNTNVRVIANLGGTAALLGELKSEPEVALGTEARVVGLEQQVENVCRRL